MGERAAMANHPPQTSFIYVDVVAPDNSKHRYGCGGKGNIPSTYTPLITSFSQIVSRFVATIPDTLITEKRNLYAFAPVGKGCRCWLGRRGAQDVVDGLGLYWFLAQGSC